MAAALLYRFPAPAELRSVERMILHYRTIVSLREAATTFGYAVSPFLNRVDSGTGKGLF